MRLFFIVLLLSACNGNKPAPIDDTSIVLVTDADGDGVFTPEDCNDQDPEIHPGATEDCSPIDRDCDGESIIGATDGSPWYPDTDHDGYGAGSPQSACEAPEGYVASNDDCNDNDPAYNPAATELDCSDPNDYNCDGSVGYADSDSDGFPACADCNDHDATISPDGIEICDNQDNNCDSIIDENSATDALPYYADQDGDGYGDPNLSQNACSPPEGWVNDATDCDDQNPSTHPGVAEVCDTIDNNCNNQIDESNSIDAQNWFMDADNDGHGDPNVALRACTQPPLYINDNSDCNDSDPAIYGGAPEYCNGQDDDCDGSIDNNTLDGSLWYPDQDQDGYGGQPALNRCTQPAGFVSLSGDCDDTDLGDYPGATEILANGDDEDCDGQEICYLDNDSDGFLDDSLPTVLSATGDCQGPQEARQGAPTGDCDDHDVGDYPSATEIIGNEDDEDCDGQEICYDDADDDGYLDNSGNTRISADNDCLDPQEGSYTDFTTDCDDNDNGDYPGATEVIGNNDDEDCDGTEICYVDSDQDGYRPDLSSTLVSTNLSCQDPGEAQENAPTGDCDDQDAGDYPGATEIIGNEDDENCDGQEICYTDSDHDGYRPDANSTTPSTDSDCQDHGEANLSAPTQDCDDNTSTIHPGATEVIGNNSDDNCDNTEICYDDNDDDGYIDNSGNTRLSTDTDCHDAQEGDQTSPTTDCDDHDPADHPGAIETIGNGDDEDCDGSEICYLDQDDDGARPSNQSTRLSTDTDCQDPQEALASDPATDCDDNDAGDYVGATEIIGNNDDENCDGTEICYDDRDDDGYLDNSGNTILSIDTDCQDLYEGAQSTPTTDCDDNNASAYPGASEIIADSIDEDCDGGEICYDDADNDGYLDASNTTRPSTDTDCQDPYEGRQNSPHGDCNDANAAQNPGATEICDAANTDEDCDHLSDDADSSVSPATQVTWYRDLDNDSYGANSSGTRQACDASTGYVALATDCDDTDAGDYPGASEIIANNDDESCDGSEICYNDDDNDGYLDSSGDSIVSSDADCNDAYEASNITPTTDCNDAVASINPGASESCNSLDDNCNGSIDEGVIPTWYRDVDTDTYGTPNNTITTCNQPNGYVSDNTDCNDNNSGIHPNAAETCDGLDQDCDGTIDDGFPQLTWYRDFDNDTYGNNALNTQSCAQPTGYVADNTDCNDTLAAIHPGATEICDSANTDEDCDNLSDDADPSVSAATQSTYYRDQDSDGYGGSTAVLRCDTASGYTSTSTDCDDLHNSVYPGASEVARDTYDNDCDGIDDVYYSGTEPLSNSKNNDHSSSITSWSRSDSNNTSFGSGLAGGLDITGDSYPDVLISDRNYDESATALNYGLTYVMAGSTTGLSSSLSTTTLQITDSNGGARSGTGVALISDISSDGYNDAIIGAPFYATGDTGRAVVFKGGPTLTGTLSQSNTSSVHLTVNGLSSSDLLGYQIAALGDFISGGSPSDWAVSAVAVDNGATSNAGAVYIINGSLSAGTYTGLTATTSGIIINGTLANGYLGTAITTFDNNGDNDPDLLISAEGANVAGNLGSVYLFDGPMSAGTYTTADASLSLASYQAAFAAPSESISCIANAGDTNNDGYEDMLLGAPGYDSSRTDIGSAALYLGSSAGISSPIATAFGSGALDNVGRSVSGAGDVDLDGYDDILIAVPSIGTNIGEVVLAYGPLSGTLNLSTAGALWLGPAANTRLGGKVSGVGDVNMDGWSDFMMSATGAVSTGSATAYTYLVYGISQ